LDSSANEEIKPEHFEHVFQLIDESGDGRVDLSEFLKVFEVFELYMYEESKSLLFKEKKMPTVSELQKVSHKDKIKTLIESVQYEFIVNILSVLNILMLTIRESVSDSDTAFIEFWAWIQIGINLAFLLELLVEMYAFGVSATYSHSFRAASETLSQVFNLFGIIYFFNSNVTDITFISALKSFELVIFVRLTRILSLLYELKTFRIIIETIKNLLGPFYTLLLVQFTIFYMFALTGILWFGGRITSTSMDLKVDTAYASTYFFNNFNDLGNGFITLFSLMVVNNWHFVS